MVDHNFKASPSARCASGDNAICKDTDILTRIILRLLIIYKFTYT
jgi:hypothetical protein